MHQDIEKAVIGRPRLHIGIAGCITGHRGARVDQQDVPLCNWISGCITGIRLRNRLDWSSVQNTYMEVGLAYHFFPLYKTVRIGYIKNNSVIKYTSYIPSINLLF